ncbi:MAG: glycosyltransferase [Acidobacteria bacterium]|nr:glycosyltransferase [Acidobacteriota bacterium]
MTRVAFLIRSLDRGGAERQLVELARRLPRDRFTVSVLTFYGGGALEPLLAGTGVELVSLQKAGRWDVARFLGRAWREVGRRRPHVVHGYLGVANELAWLLGRAHGARVAWGIRSASIDFSRYDWSHRASFLASARLSRFVDLIIYNSEAGAAEHRRSGYRPRSELVIPNGVDVDRFHRDEEGRLRVRAEWGAGRDEPLVGLVARVDPTKAPEVFLAAAARLHARAPGWRFVVVGEASSPYAASLRQSDAARSLGASLTWAGPRDDMPAVYSALDCLVLSSDREGMPNAVAEAMACETPCVTTRAGDAPELVGDTGLVVPTRDDEALADACHQMLAESSEARAARGLAARTRVVGLFSTDRLVARTAQALEALASRSGSTARQGTRAGA